MINKKIDLKKIINKKYNLIIIEGIDKSGKSTLADKLLKSIKNSVHIKANIRPYNNTKEESQKIKEYYESILELLNNKFFKDKTLIVDRFYPSQLVYSIKRGNDNFNDKWYEEFENKIIKFNHLLIYCYISDNILHKRFLRDKEEYLKIKDIKLILNRYNYFVTITKLNKILINTLDMDNK